MVLRRWSSSAGKRIYCAIPHAWAYLEYAVVIMGSATFFFFSPIQQQRLACSFNAFTNTSFDAQKTTFRNYYQVKKLTTAVHLPTGTLYIAQAPEGAIHPASTLDTTTTRRRTE